MGRIAKPVYTVASLVQIDSILWLKWYIYYLYCGGSMYR